MGGSHILPEFSLVHFREVSLFVSPSWTSYKSKRLVKSIGASEISAAEVCIDQGKPLKRAILTFLGILLRLLVVVQSRNLFTSLTIQRDYIVK